MISIRPLAWIQRFLRHRLPDWQPGGDTLPDGRPIPEGAQFFTLIWDQEDRCEKITDAAIPRLGAKVPQSFEQIGTVLSLLDRAASCWWGCAGGDHVIERLTGRTATSARAEMRLMRLGFYDEALGVVRGVGEIANLLLLFGIEDGALEEWRAMSAGERRRAFSPFQVRLRIERSGVPVPIDQNRYGLLSEAATHVSPQTSPQTYNVEGQPFLASTFQRAGVMLILNELSVALVFVAFMAAQLMKLADANKDKLERAAESLVEAIGGVTIDELPNLWASMKEAARQA